MHTFICMTIIDFEDSPLTLVLKKRLGATRKWSINNLYQSHVFGLIADRPWFEL